MSRDPLPDYYRRYLRRQFPQYARRHRLADWRAVAAVAGAGAVLALAHPGTGHQASAGKTPPGGSRPAPSASREAREAVAYAESRIGIVPYLWGGTTDAGMDCSGLVMNAWASAGISLERTSQEQWASERHVTAPAAGDLVFFAGSDGTPSSPGHVGIVVDPARHLMIDAYATGYYVEYDTYGSGESKPGLDPVVGFTDPEAGS